MLFRSGVSGVGPIRSFDASEHPTKVAAEVPDFDISHYLPSEHRKCARILGRASRFGIAAADLAMLDSGLDSNRIDHERLGVVMGTGMVPIDLPEIAPLLAGACSTTEGLKTQELGKMGPRAMVPMWMFHGAEDVVVQPTFNRALYKSLMDLGARNVKYSEYPGVNHNSWDNAFAEPELLPWMMSQKKKKHPKW